MSLAATKEAAIGAAFGMLGMGIDVLEVGPLLDPREGNVVGAEEIRNICAGKASLRADAARSDGE
jgi:hypothetical protein